PRPDAAGSRRRLPRRHLREPLEQALEALGLVRERHDLLPPRSRGALLAGEQRLALMAQRRHPGELFLSLGVEPVELALQGLLAGEVHLPARLDLAIAREQLPVAARERVQPLDALEEIVDVARFEEHPEVPVAPEP